MSTDPRVLVLEEMRKQTRLLGAILLALNERRTITPDSASAPTVDLDNAHGNPIVKAKDPRDWTGDNMNGRHFSECPPEYLDMLAERYDYFASREEDAKKKRYNELDAARARGWAARLRSGWTAPEPEPQAQGEPTW